MKTATISRIIQVYDQPIVRMYSRIRFQILRQRFLDEIGQYLPRRGHVLDIGCGFGLFTLYYAALRPDLSFHGLDINVQRIELARRAEAKLGITNVVFEVADAATYRFQERFTGAYMLDLAHHIPLPAVQPLLRQLYDLLEDGGRLILKDIDTRPAFKRGFTYLLDKLMDPSSPVHYWPSEEMRDLLTGLGFETFAHTMVDYLPYSHILYVCRKVAVE